MSRNVYLVLACTVLFVCLPTGADPMPAIPFMSINTSWSIANHDADLFHVGDELLIQYLVTNTSVPDSTYAMDKFVLPAGTNQGIYDATGPDDWDITINGDATVFESIAGANIPAGGGQGLFELYSTDLGIGQADAMAWTILDGPFPALEVDIPGAVTPLPGAALLGMLGLSTAGWMTRRKAHR